MIEKLLSDRLNNRIEQLQEAKKKGIKIVGYFPGNYAPEEIIYASGAIPICLIEGGSHHPANTALSVVPQFICPYSRYQIGEMLLKKNPYYNLIDMVVAPINCQHLKKVSELWEHQKVLDVFKLGIPRQTDYDFAIEYYAERLITLKDKLQLITGNKITDQKLSNAINLYNQIRELLRKISLLRRSPSPPISSLEFIKLNHFSYYADPSTTVATLELIYNEFKDKKQETNSKIPRILLMGPNISNGDYILLDLVQSIGGQIVIEEICEGIRYYWNNIENKGDLFKSLAKGYLSDRLPCAFMWNSARKRLEFTNRLIKDFNVAGIIWYELLCCETYDSESYFFAQKMKEQNIPMLILESDYSTATEQPKTRIQAFIEILKGV